MIALLSVAAAIVAFGCAIVTAYGLSRFIMQIHADYRENRT